MKHILSVSFDPALASTRSLILERHGYEVTSAEDHESALAACRSANFDLLMVGHTVTRPSRAQILRIFREHSQSPTLSVSPNGMPDFGTDYNAKSSDPADMLQVVRSALRLHDDLGSLLNDVIDSTQGNFGTLQLLNRAGRTLRIAVQRGFAGDFLGFFQRVHASGSACGEAMKQRARVIVEDVASSAVYDPDSRQAMLRAEAAACHSTPLVSVSGQFVGMVSSHYRAPQRPVGEAFDKLDNVVIKAMKRTSQDLDLAIAGRRI